MWAGLVCDSFAKIPDSTSNSTHLTCLDTYTLWNDRGSGWHGGMIWHDPLEVQNRLLFHLLGIQVPSQKVIRGTVM